MVLLPDMKDDSPGAIGKMQRRQARETSTVANSQMNDTCKVKPGWYRDMRVFKWVWQGVDPLLIQEIQARI